MSTFLNAKKKGKILTFCFYQQIYIMKVNIRSHVMRHHYLFHRVRDPIETLTKSRAYHREGANFRRDASGEFGAGQERAGEEGEPEALKRRAS